MYELYNYFVVFVRPLLVYWALPFPFSIILLAVGYLNILPVLYIIYGIIPYVSTAIVGIVATALH